MVRFQVQVHLVLRYLAATAVSAAIALGLGGPFLLLLWPALTFAALTMAYLQGSARLLGKRPDGGIHPVAILVFLPYFTYVWFMLQIRRIFFGESSWDEISPRIFVGRRPVANCLPPDVDLVVDCTAELVEPNAIVKNYSYRSFPTLDRWIAKDAEFAALVRGLTTYPGTIYLHCAAGKGRSASVAAALLLTRGLATSLAEAESAIRASRPQVRLHPAQRLQVERVVAELIDNQEETQSSTVDYQGARER